MAAWGGLRAAGAGLVGVCLMGGCGLAASGQGMQAGEAKAPAVSLYLPGHVSDFGALLPSPPGVGSAEQRADLARVHEAETGRTPVEVARARADDGDESMFAFRAVLGPGFEPALLPRVSGLSAHLRHESAVVNPGLKMEFHRPRPYEADASLHPVCPRTRSDSYPSGHAMVGYLEAFALVEMVPERKDAILARAREFAESRVVCGVHYPADVEASRTVSLVLFGELMGSEVFARELAGAREEVRRVLKLGHGAVR